MAGLPADRVDLNEAVAPSTTSASRWRRTGSGTPGAGAADGRPDPRRAALIAFAVLGVALIAVLVATTPWQTLPEPAGGSVAADPARDFAPAEVALEDRYHAPLWPAVLGGIAAALVMSLMLGFTPVGAWLVRTVARPLGGGWLARLLLGTLAVTGAGALAVLPFDIWSEQVRRDYGIVVRGWGSFASDKLTGFLFLVAATLIGLAVLYALIRFFPRRWWAPGGVLGAGLVVLSSFVYPLVVEPAFNDFRPLPESELRSSLLALAAADGIRVDDVLVADESKRSTRLNAYVSGIGSSRRIVLYDTTVAKLPPNEIRQIIAHEFGHVKNDDVLSGTLIGALGTSCAVCLIFVALGTPRVRRRSGVTEVTNPASLALVLGLVAAIVAVSTPAGLLVSRRVEARSDVHSLNLTRDPATLISMQRRLSLNNLADLDAPSLVIFAFATHPSGPLRIANARTWAKLNGIPVPPNSVPAAPASSPSAPAAP